MKRDQNKVPAKKLSLNKETIRELHLGATMLDGGAQQAPNTGTCC